MNKQIGKASLGWLCILAAGLWMTYKFEYFKLLLAAWSRNGTGEFDKAAEMKVLFFILSPGLILVLVGVVLLFRSVLKGSHSSNPQNQLPIV